MFILERKKLKGDLITGHFSLFSQFDASLYRVVLLLVLHHRHQIVVLVLVLMVINLLTLCVVLPVILLLILLEGCYLLLGLLIEHLCHFLFTFSSSFFLRLFLIVQLLWCHLNLDRLSLHVSLLLRLASRACDNIILMLAGFIRLMI